MLRDQASGNHVRLFHRLRMIATSPSPYGGAGFTFSLPMEFPAPLPVCHGDGD
jgi:hypothetical protein